MDAATKDFKATPFNKFDPVELSDNPARSAGRKFASDTRNWKDVPKGKQPAGDAAVVTKPNLPMLPRGGTKSHPALDTKMEKAPVTYGNSNMIKQDKSGEKNLSAAVKNEMPKKWHKKGYDMNVPSTLGKDAPRLARKWELN